MLPHNLLELLHQRLERVGGHFGILRDAQSCLQLAEALLEPLFGHIHHHIAEHHNEAAIGVIHKARIFGESNHALSGLVVQPQIENGVHHAGHRELRARTHRDQQRVLRVAESFAHPLLHHLELIAHLVHQIIGHRPRRI
jgi:hypothetical protein